MLSRRSFFKGLAAANLAEQEAGRPSWDDSGPRWAYRRPGRLGPWRDDVGGYGIYADVEYPLGSSQSVSSYAIERVEMTPDPPVP